MPEKNIIRVKSNAKINLVLDVTGERENGYHEVAMIMQSIGLYDELELEKCSDGIYLDVGREDLPVDRNNLIVKAAEKFFEYTGLFGGVRFKLHKNIPVAAGMAGGSTDAAAALKGLNMLFDAGLSEEDLRNIGIKIGADVPFCIMGGTALAEGIGEKLTVLSPAPVMKLLIVKPAQGISTKFVYDELTPAEQLKHPDVAGMREAIEEKNIKKICERLGNVLESVTIKELPFIREIKVKMRSLGADGVLMSGSGTTVFGIFTDEHALRNAYSWFKESEYADGTYVTETVQS